MSLKRIPIGPWYIGFGVFLILCGIAGYASNPEHAKTALISGGSFGSLSALWGLWMWKSPAKAARVAAGLTTLMLCAAFVWRSTVSWQAVLAGEPKRFAASLITLMLFGSALSMIKLIQSLKER